MASHPQAPPEAHPASAPLDLSGVTLTNDSNSGFSMALGNGQAFAGPIGNGQRAAAAPAPQARPSSAPNPMLPELVAAADLSSRPVPPALEGSLRANYPAEAKLRGIGGSARVRARIDPDGSVRRTQVESESFAGFGDACRRTLQASRWSAPRDHSGRPVATEIRYTCHFVVEP
jgi:TonB family protein